MNKSVATFKKTSLTSLVQMLDDEENIKQTEFSDERRSGNLTNVKYQQWNCGR